MNSFPSFFVCQFLFFNAEGADVFHSGAACVNHGASPNRHTTVDGGVYSDPDVVLSVIGAEVPMSWWCCSRSIEWLEQAIQMPDAIHAPDSF